MGRYGYSYIDKDREGKTTKKGAEADLDREKALTYAADQIKKLIYRNKLNRLGVILNTWLTNEELFLIKKIFTEDLESNKIYFPEPAAGDGDDLLLTSDRSPNTKGALEIGLSLDSVNQDQLLEGTELLFVFWSSPIDLDKVADLMPRIKKVKNKILFTPFRREWNGIFDLVLPTALPAEKGGSFINVDGKVQHFGPVLSPPGIAQAEWKWLVGLGKEIKKDFKSYARVSSSYNVFQIMKEKIKYFGK
jgi:NADH-quinone oxidoreductase subunit G